MIDFIIQMQYIGIEKLGQNKCNENEMKKGRERENAMRKRGIPIITSQPL